MKTKKVKSILKTRKDISNPHHNISHEELLKKANVELFDDYIIEELPNGRIIVIPTKKKNP